MLLARSCFLTIRPNNSNDKMTADCIDGFEKVLSRFDADTGAQTGRVGALSHFLAAAFGLSAENCTEIQRFARLHDVGKMGVDRRILCKPAPLTESERRAIMHHPAYGFELLRRVPRFRMAAEIALYHHEKWDGSGYPNGVGGSDIPLPARIVAVADIYDALRSARPYKAAFGHERTMCIMLAGDDRIDPAGHFDPSLLDLVRKRHREMDRIHRRLDS